MMESEKTVGDYMTRKVIALTPQMDVQRAVLLLIENSISGAPVVDATGHVVGMLTEKDCFRVAFAAGYHNEPCGPVAQYMSTLVETLEAGVGIVEALERFLHSRYRRFPVVAGGRLVGLISRRDALRALADLW